jgi:hypothetical protein
MMDARRTAPPDDCAAAQLARWFWTFQTHDARFHRLARWASRRESNCTGIGQRPVGCGLPVQ